MDFVRDQMAKLHHVDVTNNNFLIEGVSRTAIKKPRFTGFLHPGEPFLLLSVVQIFANLFLRDSVKNWSRHSESKCLRRNSEVRFQDLTDIHAAWDTKRIQHYLNRSSIRQERHILFRNDARDDAFIPVATSHLISDAQLALARDINFDLFDDAGIDIVAALHPIHRTLAFELQLRELVLIRADDFTDLVTDRTRIDLDVIVNYRELPQ